ncbi:MAG: hypothetical protein LCH26_05865 [Proteobacteria bacterium]|nr:hypothetical protein [Pseudomonadota bacterium]
MNKLAKIMLPLLCLGLLTGCAIKRDNMEIHDACLENSGTVVIAQIEGFEKPGFYMDGQQGLVDFAINKVVTGGACDAVEAIDTKPIIQEGYYKSFGNTFESHCFKVKELREPLKRSKLQDHAVSDAKFAPYDFTFLKKEYDADYALILDPRQFGTTRKYYGFIPMGRPKPLSVFTLYLVDLKDGSLKGHYNSDTLLDGPEDWDSPPTFKPLVDSIVRLLEKGLDDAHLYLCGDK